MNHQDTIRQMFEIEDGATDPAVVSVLGDSYIVLPGAFSPAVRANSSWFAEHLPPLVRGSRFAEIGSAAGVLPIRMSKRGHKVVATDIDPLGEKNTRLNALLHDCPIEVREGDVFSAFTQGETFDCIFWNHPWMFSDEPVSTRLAATYDYQYQSVEKFIREGKKYLTSNGYLLLGTGNIARIDLLKEFSERYGYEFTLVKEQDHSLAVDGSTKVSFLIYSLSPV